METLRAIPWIFAWTQIRMVLPAWLGIDTALRRLFDEVRPEGLLTARKRALMTAHMSLRWCGMVVLYLHQTKGLEPTFLQKI